MASHMQDIHLFGRIIQAGFKIVYQKTLPGKISMEAAMA